MENLPLKPKIAFIFPGQASQFIGMGKDFADRYSSAMDVFKEIDEALNIRLSDLIWYGKEAELNLTENTQPAIFAVSCAILAVLEKEFGFDLHRISFVAGHSLGEYSALTAAKSLSILDGARLLRLRGKAMQKAVLVGEGAMAALLGVEADRAEELCKEQDGICEIANDNAIGQIVVSGQKTAIKALVSQAKNSGIKKAVILPVSAPFHCSMMQPAADEMKLVLSETRIERPIIPLIVNVKATAIEDPERIRQYLVEQIANRVRWRESIQYMVDHGVDLFIECGAGKVLTQMLKRISKSTKGVSLTECEQIESILKSYI